MSKNLYEASQLDRIEKKVDRILDLLKSEDSSTSFKLGSIDNALVITTKEDNIPWSEGVKHYI
ncbi:hypothetical protein [Oceanobacillus sp. J11TS1]|uniref:hypothetical protein n=1 Tax=Oceanobacillus sp. J11TS1 TaxID=2807191 RepID=UPI001AFE262C|nr:hypothetical protein [Oceanobacillus sp. J11TS1]GIO25088.1 hypothetical protein J11TS1_36690 [Oceanobacillus sp. J11TS1]